VPRNQEEHHENSARKSYDEHRILNAEPDSPEFQAATIHELSTRSGRLAAISTTTTIMTTLSAVFPQSQAIQSIQQPQLIREILPPPPDISSRPESSSRTHKSLPYFGTIMPISGGLAIEFETKKQRNNYFKSVTSSSMEVQLPD
jgi:hypothetical protein